MIDMATVEARASIIAGQDVTINCDLPEGGGLNGQVFLYDNGDGTYDPIPVIHLEPSLCLILRSPTHDPQAGEALLTLGHEATHIALRTSDETLVEANALANRWQLVRQWKFPARIARVVMQQEVAFDALLPADYHREVAP